MIHRMSHRVIVAIILALSPACGDATSTVADSADTVLTQDADTTQPRPRWTLATIGPGGRQLRAAVSANGTIAVVHYADQSMAGDICSGAGSGDRSLWALRYARLASDWVESTVTDIVHLGPPRGFAFAFGPAAGDGDSDGDVPTIAALLGEPIPFYCGAHDLGLYRLRDTTWSSELVVAESNEAATGQAASDFGTVVGLWPALAFDASGAPLIAYKDVHGGGLQGDDFRRADLELAWRTSPTGSWRHLAVEPGLGAGDFIQAAFDSQGRVTMVYFHPRDELTDSRRGLWAIRSADGIAWERIRLFAGGISERPSLVIDSDDVPWVAWYDGSLGLPMVARLEDDLAFSMLASWTIEDVGDRVYDEGRHPVLAVSTEGLIGLAYQRCGRASDGIGDCNPAQDAVVFAWRDGLIWEREVLEADETGLCGTYTGLAFRGERPTVFYQCLVEGDDGFMAVLKVATREAL